METQDSKSAVSGDVAVEVPKDVLWSALNGEPHTAVAIVSIKGEVLYMNDQCARMYRGATAKASDYIGKFFTDVEQPVWYEQRLEILRRVGETGQPVMMRTVWRGWQQFSWVQPIEPEAEEATEDEWKACEVPHRFLVTTRRAAGDGQVEELADATIEIIESEVIDLGALDVLTARELEVLALIGQGMSLKEVAKTLYRSVKTIDNHRQAIGKKLNVTDRVQLAEIAKRAGLTAEDAERVRA